jgi:uncharacterized protein YndB with AHSA1/START domain
MLSIQKTIMKKPAHTGRSIRTTIRTTATPEQLWEAWADPQKLAHWFVDRAEGTAVEGNTLTWYFDRFKYAMPYDVYSAVPGRHLVLTGQPPGRPRFYLEIEIRTEGGTTVLELTNSGFLDQSGWDQEYEGIASGWRMALGMLKLYAERYFGRPRTQFFAMRPAPYEFGELLRYYREPSALGSWLTISGSIGDEGSAYKLLLRDGGTASGEVLTVAGWEVGLSWREVDGYLGLKGFTISNGRAVAIHGCGWGLAETAAADLERKFSSALDRLAALMGSGLVFQHSSQPDPDRGA